MPVQPNYGDVGSLKDFYRSCLAATLIGRGEKGARCVGASLRTFGTHPPLSLEGVLADEDQQRTERPFANGSTKQQVSPLDCFPRSPDVVCAVRFAV